MDIISGEKIQMSCDYIIGSEKDFNANPKIRALKKDKRINIDSISEPLNVAKNSRIFCYSHLLPRRDFIKKMKLIQNPFLLLRVLHQP